MKVNESRSFLLLCLADGSIYSLEAWTGEFEALTRTAPLLASDETDNEAIVPSLDGRLYWRPQDSKEEDNHDQESTFPVLQELPLTVVGLLEHPVRSCDASNENCGILTAQSTTSLIALSDNGSLLWKTAPGDDVDEVKEQQQTTNQLPTLLLQRKDYSVQHIRSENGQQSWNVSLGTFSALNFELSPSEQSLQNSPLLLDDDGIEEDPLPAIFFSNAGRTVTALHPEKRTILWRQDVPTTLSSVFGISNGQWRSVQVLDQQPNHSPPNQRHPRLFLPSSASNEYNADFYEQILHSLHYQQLREPRKPSSYGIDQLSDRYTLEPEKEDSSPFVHQCYIDVDGSIQCPTQLHLPAPEAPSGPHAEGIFLSWPLLLSVITSTFLLGALFLLRWQRRLQKQALQMEQLLERSGESTTTPPTPPTPVTVDTHDSANHSIPLVRYSRYASEFLEKQKLGKGGFGSVYECQNKLDGRWYAIKKVFIAGTEADYQQHLDRVLREVKILAVLDHPHIVRYYTAWLEEQGEDDAMEHDGEVSSSRFGGGESSSRWMESDSVSEWDTSQQQHGDSWRRNGWSRTATSHNNNSVTFGHLPRRDLRSDSFMIFEDESKENLGANSSGVLSEKLESETQAVQSVRRDDDEVLPLPTKNDVSLSSDRKRHILYIQMQLCTQRTVTEFLSDPQIRQDSTGLVDFPKALQLFLQIAEAVQHVHGRGLIHRDLKPSNCFMDELMSVKVGDFGLSRESTADAEEREEMSTSFGLHEDHTAGVGTRSYASPEQMNGSDYDASTDVFSLGIILFELLYPMYTGMERSICLSRLRDGTFPKDWDEVPGRSEMRSLIFSMVSEKASERPTATDVAKQVAAVVGEYTIVSLQNYSSLEDESIVLLRVEAREDSLRETMEWIRDEADIVEYGLRVQSNDASIMEFALQNVPPDLIHKLRKRPDIDKVRQVSISSARSGSS